MKRERNPRGGDLAVLADVIWRSLSGLFRSLVRGRTEKKSWKQMTMAERVLFLAILAIFLLMAPAWWRWMGWLPGRYWWMW